MSENVIIIGASHAGVSMAAALRQRGFIGAITLIDREAGLPRERPPLSKAWLAADNKDETAKPPLRATGWYGDNNITLLAGVEVAAIDPAGHSLTLGDGKTLNWDALVLATGGVARRMELDGDIPIHTLRTPRDAEALSHALDGARTLAVIGGGYIGLEVAAAARQRGLDVVVCEAAPRLLARVASAELAAHIRALHESQGVRIITDAAVAGIAKTDKGAVLTFSGGDAIPCDTILAGIGMLPDTRLAEAAGLACDNGIMVDACYRACADIFAIGDVARSPHYPMRIESVHHATHSAEIAAAALMGAEPPTHEIPWFWSDQYDAKLQSAGLVPPPDTPDVTTLTRKGGRDGGISFWTFAGSRLRAVESVSAPRAYMIASRLLGKAAGGDGIAVPRDTITDPAFDLKSLLR